MPDPLSEEDVAYLNRLAVERSAVIARVFGVALVVVGVLLGAAWLWSTVRLQLRTGPFGSFGDGDAQGALPMTTRIDLVAQSLGTLGLATLAAGVGLLLRLVADYAQTRVGGSVTDFRAGDLVDVDDDESDADNDEARWAPQPTAMPPLTTPVVEP